MCFVVSACAFAWIFAETPRQEEGRGQPNDKEAQLRIVVARAAAIQKQAEAFKQVTEQQVGFSIAEDPLGFGRLRVSVTNGSPVEIICMFDLRTCALSPRDSSHVQRKEQDIDVAEYGPGPIPTVHLAPGDTKRVTFFPITDQFSFSQDGDYEFNYRCDLPVYQPKVLVLENSGARNSSLTEIWDEATKKTLKYTGSLRVAIKAQSSPTNAK